MANSYASTGSLLLDIALGGGYRRGQVTSIWGKPGSLYQELAVLAAQEALRRDGSVTWVNTLPRIVEGLEGVNLVHAAKIGEVRELLIEASENPVDLFVLDSLDGLSVPCVHTKEKGEDIDREGVSRWLELMTLLMEFMVQHRQPYTAVLTTRLMPEEKRRPYSVPGEIPIVVDPWGGLSIYAKGSNALSLKIKLPWGSRGFNEAEDIKQAAELNGEEYRILKENPGAARMLRLRVIRELLNEQ